MNKTTINPLSIIKQAAKNNKLVGDEVKKEKAEFKKEWQRWGEKRTIRE